MRQRSRKMAIRVITGALIQANTELIELGKIVSIVCFVRNKFQPTQIEISLSILSCIDLYLTARVKAQI